MKYRKSILKQAFAQERCMMAIKKLLVALLALLGYRQPVNPLQRKQNELNIHIALFLLFMIYYFLTICSICEDAVISNTTFFSWLISMAITSMDNISRLVHGMNKFDKLQNPKHSPKQKSYIAPSAKKYRFHNRFYIIILRAEVLIGIPTLIIHISPLHSVCLLIEKGLM